MNVLPTEISKKIVSCCDFQSQLQLRQVSFRHYCIVQDVMSKRRKFDYSSDYSTRLPADQENIPHCQSNTQKMTDFVHHNMSSLEHFSISRAPFRITLSGLIQLAGAAPGISELSLIQEAGVPVVEKDSLYALPYFKRLKSLRLRGWNTVDSTRRGCAYRREAIPLRYLEPLESLSIDCRRDTVTALLGQLFSTRAVLKKLRHIKLRVHLSDSRLPDLLCQFLRSHQLLESVSIGGVLFATEDQVIAFYRELLSLRCLRSLELVDCTAIAQIDPAVTSTFRQSLCPKCVLFGAVTSLRYDPRNAN